MEPDTDTLATDARPETDAADPVDGRDGAPAGPPLRVLVADHRGTGLARRMRGLAELGFVLSETANLRGTLARLNEAGDDGPEVVLLQSLSGPGNVELATLERARTRRGEVAVPLLVVSTTEDPGAALRADRLLGDGPWDLVSEGTALEEIALRLRRLWRLAEREHEMERLRHRASHDDRTDLLLPRSFEARLREHFAACRRHGQELALVLIDLDRFGAVNKQHDHTVGDRIITAVGGVIRAALRVEDVAGRLGGDEFGVVLPYTGKIDAALVVKRLCQSITQLSGRIEGARGPIEVSGSLGFETFDGSDLDSVEALRAHAERALRAAKVQGGNRGVYYRELED